MHLLEGLQALARGEAAESLPREDVELGDLVDAAIYGARRRHPGVAFELREHGEEGATLHGWANGLRLVVDNLLENAALHGARPGRRRPRPRGRRLAAAGRRRRARASPPASASGCSNRSRADAELTRQGTGLGLAIVAQQVGLHGGELRLSDSELGGLAAEVRLPARA